MDDNCEYCELMTDDDKIRVLEIMNEDRNLDENTSALFFMLNPETQSLMDEIDSKLKVFQAENQSNAEVIIPNQYTDEYLDSRIKEIDHKLSKITKRNSELFKKDKQLEEETTEEDLKKEDCDQNGLNEKIDDIENLMEDNNL